MARPDKNVEWVFERPLKTWEQVQVSVLMDIRDELQTLNRLLGCVNFTRIPSVLDRIEANTKKPRRKKVVK